MKFVRALSLAATAAAIAPLAADVPELAKLPRYQTPVPCAEIRNWHTTQNLGPTGARAWIYGYTGNTTDSREILIKSVEPGSPAEAVLQPYDVIVGAAVPPDTPSSGWKSAPALKRFDSDARLAFARAVTWAESDRGRGALQLLRHRDGKTETVVIKLPVLGDYSPNAPFDCAKTNRIVANAAQFLAENMPVDGYRSGLGGPLNAMLLFATENPAYLDHVRRSACRMSLNHTISDAGHETWRWGYTNMFLCEYYLATGDQRVLPTIAEYCDVLARGQCNPGTWGHRAVPDFIPPGYGSLNSSGVVCFLSLALGKQCGVEVDEKALRNSINFYGSYAGRGGIPYGDHPPSNNASSNGKNGMAAVAFNQLGAEYATQWFARLSCSSNLLAFEGGHTGNFFNQTWTPLGASLSGRENYRNFWSRFNSYRDMARRCDGSFMTQPFPHLREGDLGTGNYVSKGPMWTTGGFALSYLATTGRLAVLGRTDSVFGADAPQELKEALDLYRKMKFAACAEAADALAASSDPRVAGMAKQLASIARRNLASIDLTLTEMSRRLEVGDLVHIRHQLQAIESIVPADDARLEAFRAAVEDPANEPVMASGAQFYNLVPNIGFYGLKGFRAVLSGLQGSSRHRGTLKGLATRGEGVYRRMAEAYLAAHPLLPLDPATPLMPPPSGEAECWRLAPDGKAPHSDWKAPSFNDGAWKPISLPSKELGSKNPRMLRGSFPLDDPSAIEALALDYATTGRLQVYLNGTLIMDVSPSGSSTTAKILLKPSTRELLRAGTNHLAVAVAHPPGNNEFKLALEASMKGP
jgi:hypothetical protein